MGVIIRQSIKGTIVTYIGSFIGFLTTMFIVTKYLTQEELGLTRVLFDAAFFLGGLAVLGLPSAIIKFFPHFKSKDGNNNGFFFYIVTIPLAGIAIFFSLFLLLKTPISNYFSQNSELFVRYYNWVLPLAFFIAYWFVFESYSYVLMRVTIPKFVREILIRLLLIVVYLLYAFKIINIDGFVACYVAIYGIAMLAVFLYVAKIGTVSLKHNVSFINKPLKKEYLSYTGFVLLGSLGGQVISKIDVFMISAGIGLASTGIYTIALFMAAVIEIPSRSMNAISSPIASEHIKYNRIDEVDSLYKKVSLHQLLLGTFIFILIWINIDNIYLIIPNGNEYAPGKWAFLFLGLARMIEVTFSFGASIIQYSKYYHWSTYFVLFLSALTILTNYLLIPVWGIIGASVATLLTCLISYSLQQIIIHKKIKVSPFSPAIVKIFVIIIGALSISFLLPQLSNPWLDAIYRTTIIATSGFAVVYFWNVSSEVNNLVGVIVKKIKPNK